PAFQPLSPAPDLAARGRDLVKRLNCARCHDDLKEKAPPESIFPALAKLDPAKGCLEESPGPEVPRFDLSARQRDLIRTALPVVETETITDAQAIDSSLVAFNCLSCHERKGLGGIDPSRDAYFTGTREALGNQGRIPPPLTQVGAKLTTGWLAEVLFRGGRQRDYLNTRMPRFGEANVGHLVDRFDRVDRLEAAAIPKTVDIQESKDAGYSMMGVEGFSCIACHDYNGQKSAGAGALDLVDVTRRLKKNWFHLYLREPQRFHPTVIMPSYWPGGQSMRKELLGGDPGRQIEALWTYLEDGRRARPPVGLSRQANELRVADETVMCRGRGSNAGFRGIGVGYPERISLAFDTEEMALRLLWKGEFANIDNGSFSPRGSDRIEFPPGIPFHRLGSIDEDWPYKGKTDYAFPQDHGYQYLGYELDRSKRPAFRYRYGEVNLSDKFEDRLDGQGNAFFHRTLTFSATSSAEPFFFRVASGRQIEKASGGWKIDRLTIRLGNGVQAQIREGDPGELLLPLTLPAGETVIEIDYQW
ncbi:MAG: hypothetical protein KDL87_14890, partial [Verrucomicrobiae bacterium]|nr:hypothetical protein [Verrucomicrobiae bacterium]